MGGGRRVEAGGRGSSIDNAEDNEQEKVIRRHMSRRKLLVICGLVAAVFVLLSWPAATWLQCRGLWVGEDPFRGAVYLVGGERDQYRRIAALVSFVREADRRSTPRPAGKRNADPAASLLDAATEGTPGSACGPMVIWIGNDRSKGRWSKDEQCNLTVGQWAVKRVEAELQAGGISGGFSIIKVPGRFNGTDGEMEALASYWRSRADVGSVALVTSPFHARRAVWRLRRYAGEAAVIRVVCARAIFRDRAPWVVLAELVKMGRDRLGWSRVPLLSRGRWMMGAEPGGNRRGRLTSSNIETRNPKQTQIPNEASPKRE